MTLLKSAQMIRGAHMAGESTCAPRFLHVSGENL